MSIECCRCCVLFLTFFSCRVRHVFVFDCFWLTLESKWKNWDGVLAAAKSVIHCLESPLLPVRLCAAEVIPYMCHLPVVAQAVEGILPHVVQRIIAISNQVDSDEIMASLERLVAKYPTKMAPLALQLIPPVIKVTTACCVFLLVASL